jgi:predicted DNA-binding antitoxin AbrB/MazE fold protein
MTPLVVEATFEDGVLKPAQALPLKQHDKVRLTVEELPAATPVRAGYGMLRWTGSIEDLDSLIEDVENDPLEGP